METPLDERAPAAGPLAGMSFVLTGTLERRSREEAEAEIVAQRRQGHGLGLEEDVLRRRRREPWGRSSRGRSRSACP